MKIEIKKVKEIPKKHSSEFGICVYGDKDTMDKDVKEWIDFHGFKTSMDGKYTNIWIDKEINDVFYDVDPFEFLDGFSPNLNKHLHVGHATNMIYAKAMLHLGIAKKTVAILGDTVTGKVSKDEAFAKYQEHCDKFKYPIDHLFWASTMTLKEDTLKPGTGKYENTMIFEVGDEKIVGIKSDGSTSYFYQDVALAQELNALTLYMTGHEQDNHFKTLQKMFPSVNHVGLGLVQVKSQKMSSRLNNTIMFDDVLNALYDIFFDEKLCYNIIAGLILRSEPTSNKNINMDILTNPLNSPGLYITYALVKMKSAGVVLHDIEKFNSKKLQFALLKSKTTLKPNCLLHGLLYTAESIHALYTKHQIRGNEQNNKMFSVLASDLLLGMKMLGLFEIERI